jgi:hypothetical protein
MNNRRWVLLGLLALLPIMSCRKANLQRSLIAPQYQITFRKEDNVVRASYDLSVPGGGPALLADFKLYVDGKNLLKDEFQSGQTAFKSSVQYVLEHPDKDVVVGYSLATNEGWSRDDHDTLRGAKRYDDIDFHNP